MPEPLLLTRIRLPDLLIEKIKIGNNTIAQFAHGEQIIDVAVFDNEKGTYKLVDSIGRCFYLRLPRARKLTNENSYCLKTAAGFTDINSLDIDSKLYWERHPLNASPEKTPENIRKSWVANFIFKEDRLSKDSLGLRSPQIGAIHSIFGKWSVDKKCYTIVMPTGTGKTETMLSVLVYGQCEKVLILVPSNTLRTQIFEKFCRLGCLQMLGVIKESALLPRIAYIKHAIQDSEVAKNMVSQANVIIATPNVLNNFSDAALAELVNGCSHLFIDEAHHASANTWSKIKKQFSKKPILQFTATPFRLDGKSLEGEIIYNYPLGKAQDDGYFKEINLVKIQEFEDRKIDAKIAEKSIEVLEADLLNDLDHLLLVRGKDISRAQGLFTLYSQKARDHNPVLIHSNLTTSQKQDAFSKIMSRNSRVLVCVDMFGEGFDLPNLKIAAIHDVHKSLAVTLQFIGRFTRSARNVGNATVVVDISDPKVKKELEDLYSGDPDWNKLIKQKSETTIQKEIDIQELVQSFTGDLSTQISLWNLRPALSTLLYKTSCTSWTPQNYINVLPKNCKHWNAISRRENTLVIVISKQEEVKWGKYKDIKNSIFDLIVAHWSNELNCLFIYGSDYDVINCDKLAREICGQDAEIKNGPAVFNIFAGIELPMVRNLGASASGAISYTMFFGPNVATGLTQVEKAQSTLNNIFGWGYDSGEKVSLGCSQKKGKIWARGGGPILAWRDWCHYIAAKVFDNTIEELQIIKDFLKPELLIARPVKIPVSVDWGEGITVLNEDSVSIFIGAKQYPIYDTEIQITEFSDSGPIKIKIKSEDKESIYNITYTTEGKCNYVLESGDEIKIKKYSGESIPFTDYVSKDPIIITYADGSFSYNQYFVQVNTPAFNIPLNKIISKDWNATNIRLESEGRERNAQSIQYKMIEGMMDDYDVIFNDDAPGEAADIIAIRQDSEDSYRIHLIHCKFSSDNRPGYRINDIYALTGQAQKCIKWKHNGFSALIDHMKRREKEWNKTGHTRFRKGNFADLAKLKKFSRYAKLKFEVSIVQPGLSKAQISDDIKNLLGSTDLFLKKTTEATFNVVCSN